MDILRRALGVLIVSMCLTSAAFSSAYALAEKPILAVEVAEKAALACDQHARANGWKLNIAVLDDGGGLLYFGRDPAAFRGSVDISINKAWTATQFGFPTRLFGEMIVNRANGIQYTPRLIIFPGGLPIKAGDWLVGVIGVSGATGDQDEECAKVGLEAVKDMLK